MPAIFCNQVSIREFFLSFYARQDLQTGLLEKYWHDFIWHRQFMEKIKETVGYGVWGRARSSKFHALQLPPQRLVLNQIILAYFCS